MKGGLIVAIHLSRGNRDPKRLQSQATSLVALAIALYSASVEDRETVSCCLVFHEIGALVPYQTEQNNQLPSGKM